MVEAGEVSAEDAEKRLNKMREKMTDDAPNKSKPKPKSKLTPKSKLESSESS